MDCYMQSMPIGLRVATPGPPGIVLNEHIAADGARCSRKPAGWLGGHRLEAPRRPYRSGKSGDWVKVKNPDSPARAASEEGGW